MRRRRDAVDRRKVLVDITEVGTQLAWAIYGPMATEGVALLDGFSESELRAIQRYLNTSREVNVRHRALLAAPRG